MADVRIAAGNFAFRSRFERAAAPLTCARFERLLPYRERLIHVRWSGEACWIPLGGLDLGLGYENATSYPAPGQLLFHPGGISETEILLGLWQRPFRQQGRAARWQSLSDHRRRSRAIARARPLDAVAGRSAY
jgi:uncharacterized protein DUF3830